MTKTDTEIRVLKLRETHEDARLEDSDGMAVFRIWTLLTGGETMRDMTVAERKVI